MGSIKQDRAPVTLADLEALRDSLNRSNFVRESGNPYFIRRTFDGEKHRHELDRRA